MALVLCIGTDAFLVETRRLLLEKAGHTVITALTARDVTAACERRQFDVVVIGQRIPPKEKLRALSLARQSCPSAKILELYMAHAGRDLEGADDWLCVPMDVPDELPEHVAALARRRAGAGAS